MTRLFTLHAALTAVYLVALSAYIIAGTWSVPFHGDESTQIFMSHDFHYQFVERDLNLVRFRDDSPAPGEQYLRLINGSVNKYTVGLAWHLGGLRVDDVNEQWEWTADWDYNLNAGHIPSAALLTHARIPSALFLAAGAVVMFALGHMVGGRAVAYLAGLYYALNPALLVNGRRAMMEGSLIFSGLLVVLAGIWLLRRPSWWSALGLGAAGGFALASKHTNAFVLAAVFGAVALYPIVRQLAATRLSVPARRRMLIYLLLAALTVVVIFGVLNPVWWGSNPLEHTLFIVKLRGDLLSGQVATFGGYSGALDQFGGFLRQTFVNLPQYFEVDEWGSYPVVTEQIAAYESSLLRGVSIGGSLPGAVMLMALTLVGGWRLLRDQQVDLPARWVVGVWSLVTLLVSWLLTPIEWQRYYLPAYPVVGLLAALGTVWIMKSIVRRQADISQRVHRE